MQNAKIAAMEEDVIKLRDNTLTSDSKENVFSPMTINCVEYTDKEKAGKMLLAVLQDLKGMEVRDIGEYRGFNMSVSFDSVSRNIRVTLKNRYSYSTDLGLDAFPNLLATFSTTYYASNTNRTTNLKLAAKKVNLLIITT